MQKIRKAIIPVAGYGTRFLPVTKAQPKEMLPVVDKPTIQYLVEEAVQSGITDIIIVTSWNKRAVEDHFDNSWELESWLRKNHQEKLLNEIRNVATLANFIFIRQKGPYGNGTAVLNAKHLIGNEPFAVIWGDDLIINQKWPRLKQLMAVYEKYQDPVLTAYQVDRQGTKKYGIIDGLEIEKDIYQVKKIIEKPGPEKAPSLIASLGGYILTPDIFAALEQTPLGKDKELWLVDAIFRLSKKRAIYAKKIQGVYYDVGSKLGWLKANVEVALKHQELSKEFKKYLKNLKIK